ncbi:hypothetical protein [Moritella viscosa]|uniref:hypothetical protein n=1 Tax=Moritella viscosa TaxID=80854 RepID=UPI00091829F3|nr:hypothetical protein [Moritella viscosa]SHO15979.1 Putative uncharacterized protein [Moritella viscosa]SHO19166.1 Putative uncharacterized protein [Moritella viscosa]
MKKALEKIIIKVCLIYFSHIFKYQKKHSEAVLAKLYIHALTIFPDNKMSNNLDIAFSVRKKFFDISKSDADELIKENQEQAIYEEVLYDEMKSNQWLDKTISMSFLLQVFYFSIFKSKDRADEALEKAKIYDKTAKPLIHKDLRNIKKAINADQRKLKKELKKVTKEKVEREKLKIINPISIGASDVTFFLSFFSTLFLASGILYNKLFFASFDISIGNFFTITDYLATSIDVIAKTMISFSFGIMFLFWGMLDRFNEELYSEQLDIENDNKKRGEKHLRFIIIIISTFIIGFLVNYFLLDKVVFSLLVMPVYFISLYTIINLPIWKFVKNELVMKTALVSLAMFLTQIGHQIFNNVENIKNIDYESQYEIKYIEKYNGDKNGEFISSNSNYVFLWDKQRKEISIISKSMVTGFYVK